MSRAAPFVPLVVIAALVLLPSGEVRHLSMQMPGLGGAALSSPSFGLLVATVLAALLQGAWLLRVTGAARDAGWALALSPLAVSAVRASSLMRSADLDARIAEVGSAGNEHMWALLAALALAVGFGGARVLDLGAPWRVREPRDVRRAVSALALTAPFVGLILASSTGVDWVSSWIRWGGCGLAAIVCALGALAPGRPEARTLGGTTFAIAVAFGLLAEREYVEALGHAALAHRDPFDPAVEWTRGMREIALALEPRERYGPLAALLPWLALAPVASWRRARPQIAAGIAALALGVVAATTISSRLDDASVFDAAPALGAALDEPEEIRGTRDVLPRTATWLRAMMHAPDVEPPPARCAAWTVPARAGGGS